MADLFTVGGCDCTPFLLLGFWGRRRNNLYNIQEGYTPGGCQNLAWLEATGYHDDCLPEEFMRELYKGIRLAAKTHIIGAS